MSETTETRKRLPVGERRELFREVRKTCGVTLHELGKMAHVSLQMLSFFETDQRDLSVKAWNRVAAAMEKCLVEANKKRDAEIAEVRKDSARLQEAAAKLFGAPLTGHLSELAGRNSRKIVLGIAKNALRVERERDQLKALVLDLVKDAENREERIALLEEIDKKRERLCALLSEQIEILHSEDVGKDEKIARLEEQKKLLVDLLDTETDKALAGKRATELREKISLANES
jgi:DNA-binding XRE family transcriptional regulator